MIELDLSTIAERIGEEIAVGEWLEITQARIVQFADATDDTQWIHVDSARAERESPFHTTIAHGFLTLSLISTMLRRAITCGPERLTLNYGLNRVRFVTPVPAGSLVRGRFSPLAVGLVKEGVQVTWGITIERQGAEKPCCVVEWIVRYYTAGQISGLKPEA